MPGSTSHFRSCPNLTGELSREALDNPETKCDHSPGIHGVSTASRL